MKIKVVDMTYEQALAQPPAKHRPPQRPPLALPSPPMIPQTWVPWPLSS